MQGLTKKHKLINPKNPKNAKIRKQTRKITQRGGTFWDSLLKQIGVRSKTNANEIEGAANTFKQIKSEIQTKVNELNTLFGKVMPSLEKCQTTIQTSQNTSNEFAAAAAKNAGIAPLGAPLGNLEPSRQTAPIGAGIMNESDDMDDMDMRPRPAGPPGGLGNPPRPTELIGGNHCMSSNNRPKKPKKKRTKKNTSES